MLPQACVWDKVEDCKTELHKNRETARDQEQAQIQGLEKSFIFKTLFLLK